MNRWTATVLAAYNRDYTADEPIGGAYREASTKDIWGKEGTAMADLLYQGHGSYRITTDAGTVIFVDPYVGEGYDLPADVVIVTHEHPDHNKVELVTLKPGARILRASDLLVDGEYQTIEIADITVRGVPACNENHPIDRCVGVVLSLDDLNVYGAGDTSYTDYMRNELSGEDLDYAILPCDGIYNMNAEEAAHCARILGAKHSIPVHMDPDSLFSEAIAKRFDAPGRLILRPGEVKTL